MLVSSTHWSICTDLILNAILRRNEQQSFAGIHLEYTRFPSVHLKCNIVVTCCLQTEMASTRWAHFQREMMVNNDNAEVPCSRESSCCKGWNSPNCAVCHNKFPCAQRSLFLLTRVTKLDPLMTSCIWKTILIWSFCVFPIIFDSCSCPLVECRKCDVNQLKLYIPAASAQCAAWWSRMAF